VGFKLPTSTWVRNGSGRPQHGLNQRLKHRCNGRVSIEPDALVKLLSTQGGKAGGLTDEDYEQDGLRARSEQALGELAQALVDNPTLHNAITAALGARERALEAQQAAMSALNLPSATDVERLERRLRSFSQRLEDVEEAIDDLSRELGALRRENAKKGPKKAKAQSQP
jgi:chromosome segregation ATPase